MEAAIKYQGKICRKHPEAAGARYRIGHSCVPCVKLRAKQDPASGPRYAAIAAGRAHYQGKMCAKHPDLRGKRYVRSATCIQCATDRVSDYRKTPQGRANVINNSRRRKYGVTPEQFTRLFEAQGSQCAICLATNAGGRDNTWNLDHNHTTGKPRGVLCARCNVGLGCFDDDAARLEQAVDYLKSGGV